MFSKRLISFLSLEKLSAAIALTSGWFGGLLTVAQAWLLATIIDAVFLQKQDLQQVWAYMLWLLGVYFAKAGLIFISDYSSSHLAIRVKNSLRDNTLNKIAELGPIYATGEKTGELSLTLLDGIESIDAYYSQYLPQLVFALAIPTTMLFFVFPLDTLTGVVFIITAPLVPFFMILIGRYAESLTQKQYGTLSILAAHFYDVLQGITTLKIFGRSKGQAGMIREISDHYREITMKVLRITFLSSLALELLTTLSTAIIAVEIGLRLIYGNIQFQQAFFLLILAPEFYFPLRQLGLKFHAGMSGVTASKRIWQILDTDLPKVELSRGKPDFVPQPLTMDFKEIRLENITFKYPGRNLDSLIEVDLVLNQGNTALIGATGSGKSTISSLLMRFIEPAQGLIMVDGKPLTAIPAYAWRGSISWVPQNPYLFFDSVRENLLISQPQASQQDLELACQKAGILETILALPEKFETRVGERGSFLSGGQAQRIAIARAFLKNAPIIILDEPTSNLDVETEQDLTKAIRELTQNKITLTIAHRLNTIIGANMIYLLEKGRIVDFGSHAEMLDRGGAYKNYLSLHSHSSISSEGETR